MNNGIRLKRREADISLLLLVLAVLMQIALWSRMNLKYFYISDYDAAMLFYHIMQIWEEKTFLIPDWVYMTTGEWDCASLPALLFYGLTGNIKLSFGIANVCNVVLFAFVVSRVFRAIPTERGRNKGMLLAISLLLMPYCWGQLDYSNMLFYSGAQYIYKVLLPVWLISLYVGMPRRKFPAALYIAGYFILVFATASSSGVYVFMCGLFPVLCGWFVRAVGTEGKRFDYRAAGISVLTVLLCVAGLVFQKAANLTTRADAMTLTATETLFPNILKAVKDFTFVIEMLPSWTHLEIFSLDALICYFKMGVIVMMLLMGLGQLKHCFMIRAAFAEPKRMQDDALFVKAGLASVFVWNLCILILTESTPRYHLIGFIPFAMLACISLAEKLEACTLNRFRRWIWIFLAGGGMLLAVILFLDARDQVTDEKERYSELLISEAEAQDVEIVVLLDDGWWAERTRPLDPERVYVAYSTSLQKMINFDVPAWFNDMSLFDRRHMLVVQPQYPFENLPQELQERYTLAKEEWNIKYYIAEEIDMDHAAAENE